MTTTLITTEQRRQMLANAEETRNNDDYDPKPVVKLFNPIGRATWLLTELDIDEPDIAFGLCDLGMGFPELGCVYLPEIEAVRLPLGLKIERDLYFVADKTLSEYAEEARRDGWSPRPISAGSGVIMNTTLRAV